MLTDAAVERYSRQILLPEVGGRGQARLLEARVYVQGDDAAAVAIDLLERAGVHVDRGPAVAAGVLQAHLPGGVTVVTRPTDGGVRIATTTRPLCPACRSSGSEPSPASPAPDRAATTDQIVGALVAGECLRALLGLPPQERLLHVDLTATRCQPAAPSTMAGCPVCTDLS
jgi:hypothetical protein